MVGTELGACEWFVWDLRRSNLLERGQLEQLVTDYLDKHPRAEPPELAEYLVQQNLLTRFQADRLLSGKTEGFVLGPFTLVDALGSGSMGTVYKARSKNDDRWYAVKVLPRRSMWNIRIARRKVREFEEFSHPAVVPFVDVGTSGGTHYLTWPLVEGTPLDKVVEAQGKLAPGLAAFYALQTAEGLEACHKRNLLHGLLKPSDMMVTKDGQVKILDFGVGCLLTETEEESVVDTMSTANTITSGLDWTSPEAIADSKLLSPASDQYSLGCILYYCLTGHCPFPEETAVDKMLAHQTRQPRSIRVLVADVPEELVQIVERLMQKAPADRYASISDAVSALRGLADAGAARAVVLPQARPAAATVKDSPRPAPAKASPPTPKQAATPKPAAATPPPAKSAKPAPRLMTASLMPTAITPAPQPLPSQRPASPPPSLTLPDRHSLGKKPADVSPAPRRVSPKASGGVAAPSATPPSLEDKLGPIGIAIGAVLMCLATWFVAFHVLK